jgi:ribosomal protein L12E/L44/L45/RPP1/RPP2
MKTYSVEIPGQGRFRVESEQELTDEQAYQAALMQAQKEPPTQRLRTAAQGFTMGASDEAEAAIVSRWTGRPYDEVLSEIRTKIKAYQQAQPVESTGAELMGAAGMGLLTAPLTGGASIPMTLGRAAALSGAQGGITGFASAEGGMQERGAGAVTGAVTGAALGPIAQKGMEALGFTADKVVDWARRNIGGRGSKAVETEIQRLASTSGMTTDEIVDRIAKGEIMAENETLRTAVRALYSQGGSASNILREALTVRPEAFRKSAQSMMQAGLTPGVNKSVLRSMKMTDDAARAAERQAYKQAFEQGGIISPELTLAFGDAIKKVPNVVENINRNYRAETGKKNFFEVVDGNVKFDKGATLEDFEIARRALRDEADQAYRAGQGSYGEILKNLELNIKTALDAASQPLAKARAGAAALRQARDAFGEGRKALTKSADQVDLEVQGLNAQQLQAYRSGVMDSFRNKFTTGQRKSLMTTLADPESKEAKILRSVYPQDSISDLMKKIDLASQSQKTATSVLGGSQTAPSLLQAQKVGSNVSAQEMVSAMSGDPFALLNVTRKILSSKTQNLSEPDRERVAKILVETDPTLVRRALQDDSVMADLQRRVGQIMGGTAVGARSAGAYGAGAYLTPSLLAE